MMSPDLNDDLNSITTNQPAQIPCHSRSLHEIVDIEASTSSNGRYGGAAMMTRRKKGVKEVTKNTKKKKLDDDEQEEEDEPSKRKRITLDDSESSSSSRNLLRLRSGKKTNNYLVSLKNQQGIAKLAEKNQHESSASLRPITRGQKARAAVHKEAVDDSDEVFGKYLS